MTDTLERSIATEPPRRRRRRSRVRSMLFVTLLVSVGLMAAGVLPVQQYLERGNQVNAARDRLAVLEADNAALRDDASALLSEQEIERVAREQYGFVRPGEISYVVITPDEADPSGPVAAVTTGPSEPRSFLERIWDFVTGGDVAGDG
ncbi:MAG: septum formation initiator family protein [Acidimicrobiia bacterium]